jgi:hypothetical protein
MPGKSVKNMEKTIVIVISWRAPASSKMLFMMIILGLLWAKTIRSHWCNGSSHSPRTSL